MSLPVRHSVRRASGGAYSGLTFCAGSVVLLLLQSVTGMEGIITLGMLVALLMASILFGRVIEELRRSRRQRKIRIALIGGVGVAERLRRDLERCSRRYVCVGRIAPPGDESVSFPALAHLGALRHAVVEHDIQLLIQGPDAPHQEVVEELVNGCLHLGVQLVALSSFYEDVFGFVPISEMNAFWFQYLVDPSYRQPNRFAKHALDLIGALLLGVPGLLLCCVLVPLIRRDGGPAIFRQTRIGEAGTPFMLYKLRTMHASSGARAQWAAVDDARVTRLGRVLRRSHLDELPQLLNVLRGEMSLVGPRPEQAGVVERLELAVPFYHRRHLIRPGISGWAQVRCGYARSESGSVLKHCHDLYYLKNRSIAFDLVILAMTARLVLVGAMRRTEAVARSVASFEPVPSLRQVTHDVAPSDSAGEYQSTPT